MKKQFSWVSEFWSTVSGVDVAFLPQSFKEGYWHQRAGERHGKPAQGNRELLVVKDKLEDPQVSLG